MATVEERYVSATAYVRRAIDVVEERGIAYSIDPVTGIVEWYAGKTKTQQPRNELAHLEARWLRATTDADRAWVTREAELLADRVEESLPGAPQDRARTNLYEGEQPRGTPTTSYAQEVAMQAATSWDWVSDHARSAADTAGTVGKWLVLGGGVVLGWKALRFWRQHIRLAAATETERALNASLEDAARNARSGYYVRSPDTDLYYRVVRDDGGFSVLLVPLLDNARDAISDREVSNATMPDGTHGEAYADDIARYEPVSRVRRRALR